MSTSLVKVVAMVVMVGLTILGWLMLGAGVGLICLAQTCFYIGFWQAIERSFA